MPWIFQGMVTGAPGKRRSSKRITGLGGRLKCWVWVGGLNGRCG